MRPFCVHMCSSWMPPLNWPFISHHLKLKAQAGNLPNIERTSTPDSPTVVNFPSDCGGASAPYINPTCSPLPNTMLSPCSATSPAKRLHSGRHTGLRDPPHGIQFRGTRPDQSLADCHQRHALPQPHTTTKQRSPDSSFLAHTQIQLQCTAVAQNSCPSAHLPCPAFPPSYLQTTRSCSLHLAQQIAQPPQIKWEELIIPPADTTTLPCACAHLRSLLTIHSRTDITSWPYPTQPTHAPPHLSRCQHE